MVAAAAIVVAALRLESDKSVDELRTQYGWGRTGPVTTIVASVAATAQAAAAAVPPPDPYQVVVG